MSKGTKFDDPSIGSCRLVFGVRFTAAQDAALDADERSPRWDLEPPQREEYMDDTGYALALRRYADRLIAARKKSAETA